MEPLEVLNELISETGKEFATVTDQVREEFQNGVAQLQSSILLVISIESIAIPAILGLPTLSVVPTSTSISGVIFSIVIAAIAILVCMSIRSLKLYLFKDKDRNLVRMNLAWTYLSNALRTRIIGETVSKGEVLSSPGFRRIALREYYYFFLVFDAAMRYWLLRKSGRYLDAELRTQYQAHVDYMIGRDNEFWEVIEKKSPYIEMLLAGNPDVKREVEVYSKYDPNV